MTSARFTTIALALGLAVAARGQVTTLTGNFTGTTLDAGWSVGGTGYTPQLTANGLGDANGSGWLQLTSNAGNEATYAVDTTSFASTNATITATFNYAAFNGSGADGITFFLADASTPFAVGAYGGSLGYAQKTAAGGGGADIAGMAGGYIGLGLDEFGNFSNPTEGRIGGTGFVPNAIAVRGPGSGLTGYNYLGGTNGTGAALAFPGSTTRPTGANLRTIEVVITATNQMTVSLETGNSGIFNPLYSIDLSGYARPDSLIMGFTASTGGSTDVHQVQSVSLTSVVANLWTNGTANSTWGAQGSTTNDTNWNNTPASNPSSGSDILFDNTFVSTAQTIAVSGNQVVRNLQIDAPFSYTIGSSVGNGSIEFNGSSAVGPSGIMVSQTHGTAAQTINSNITADNAIQIQNNSASTLTLAGTVGLAANAATFNGSGATTVSGIISGTGASIVQSGTGDTTLSGANTYTGGTILSAGTLTANNHTALGTAGLTMSGGTLASTNGSSIGNAIALTGSAGLSGITTSGALTETGGSYTLNMANATQSGAVNISNNATAQTLTVESDSGTSTISGVIANGGTSAGDALVKTGAGTLVLSGVNTYTGSTTLNAGTLKIGVNNAINTASALTLAGGNLALNGFSDKVGNLTVTANSTLDFGGSANAFVFGSMTDAAGNVLTINNFSGTDELATTTAGLAAGLLNDIYFSGSGSGTVEAGGTTTNDGVASYRITANTAFTTWNGGSGANSSYSTGANWVGGTAPASANTTKVDFTGTVRLTPTLTASTTVNAVKFDAAAGSLALGGFNITEAGKTLTLAGIVPSIIQQSAYAQTISGGTVALGANSVVDVSGAGALNISSIISGAFSLDKLSGGTLNLSGANTYSGGTIVGAGIVGVTTSNAALGTGAVTVSNGATLQVNDGRSLSNALTINGNGSVNGAIDSNPGSGNTATLSGGVTLGSNSTISSDSGTLSITGGISGSGSNLILSGAGATTVGSAITTGTGTVTLNGSGATTLSGANTYTGTTTLNSGTLNLSGASGTPTVNGTLAINGGTANETTSGQIATTSAVTLSAGALALGSGVAQNLQSVDTSVGSTLSLATGSTLSISGTGVSDIYGTVSGAGALNTSGTGTTVLSGANTYTGGTTVANIANVTSNAGFGTGAVAVTAGGNVQIQGNVSVGNAFNIASTGTAFAGAFENVSGNNTLSGAVTVSGSSRIQSDSGTLTVSGAIGLGGNSLNVGGNSNTTLSGAITGTSASSLVKDGTGTLVLGVANPSFVGSVAVNAGTLQTNVAGAFTGSNAITVASGATLNTNGFNQTVGAFTDNGALNMGTNTILTLTGSSALDGTLAGSGTIILNAGSTLTLGANFNDSSVNIELNGGTLDLNGTTDTFGTLSVNANSTMDFGSGLNSIVNFSSTTMVGAATLAVTNWTNVQDYFYTQSLTGASPNTRGTAPEDQVTFTGFTSASTEWDGSSHQITPVPEPSQYGAILVGLSVGLAGYFRMRSARRSAAV